MDTNSGPGGTVHRRMRSLVDRHFAGTIRPSGEQELRAHLPGCAGCASYYNRHLLLASVDPEAVSAEERLAAGLGLRRRSPLRSALPWAPVAATAALLVVMVAPLLDRARPESGFVARGPSPAAEASLLVYRVPRGAAPALARTRLGAGDELAFAYSNPAGKRYLMVFGVDERANVHWYHPAWTDPAATPEAVALQPTTGVVELPEAVRHELRGKELHLYGVFSDQQLSVREVEALVKRAPGAGAPLAVPGATQRVFHFAIEPAGDR